MRTCDRVVAARRQHDTAAQCRLDWDIQAAAAFFCQVWADRVNLVILAGTYGVIDVGLNLFLAFPFHLLDTSYLLMS